jgi:TonB-linked SusC/RagA family outer membrane protein
MIFSLAILTQSAFAQQVVRGTVTSGDDGTALPGVNIFLKGTTVGTVSDLGGNYSINVTNLNDTIVFSFVGYQVQEIPVRGQSVIDVVLQIDAELLEEVVVIGYGTVKKSDLTGAVAVVTAEDLNKTPAPDFAKALQGRATGVVVTQNGNPASAASIRIRGIGSINSDDDPLIVIDGIISDKISEVAPEDIESLQVLKDASATAIYGANGANGVIIITTKRGRPGKIDVSFSAYGKLNRKPKYYDIMDATQYSAFYDTLLVRNNQTLEPAYSDGFRQYYYGDGWEKGTDWQKEILQDSYTQNYFLRVSGGGETSNFSLSTNYFNDKGILINNLAERYNVRANADFKIGKYISIGATTLVARRRTSGGSSGQWGAWTTSLYVSPLMRVRVEDPEKGYYPLDGKEGYEGPQVPFDYVDGEGNPIVVNNTGWNDKGNPVPSMALNDQNSYNNTILASIYAEIKPFPWLTYRIYPSVDLSMNRSRSWTPAYDNGVRSVPQAQLDESYSEGMTLSLENQITLAHSFGAHNFTLTGVNHIRKGQWTSASITAPGFIYEQLPVIDQSDFDQRVARGNSSPWTQNSYLARLIYDYRSKYLLTASIRRDGSSNFGPENKWGTFPSFSAAWKMEALK